MKTNKLQTTVDELKGMMEQVISIKNLVDKLLADVEQAIDRANTKEAMR